MLHNSNTRLKKLTKQQKKFKKVLEQFTDQMKKAKNDLESSKSSQI